MVKLGWALLLVLGCSTQTSGQDNRATFSYNACLVGCPTTKAMMVGTQEAIGVSPSDNTHSVAIPPVSVVSSAPNVISVGAVSRTCCAGGGSGACTTQPADVACTDPNASASLTLTVNALAAGSATISLQTDDGSTFDDVVLEASEPVGLAVTCDNNKPSGTMAKGQSCTLGWSATDASGNALQSTTGVTFASSDANVVAFQSLLGQPTASAQASQAILAGTSLVAEGSGDAVVTASARSAKTAVPIHVQ